MRNFLCKGSFFSLLPLREEVRDGEVATLGSARCHLGFPTLKSDSSGLLPGVWAVVKQNWDEAQQKGSKWTELVWKCPVRRTSSGQIVAQPGCHLLGFHPHEQARGGHGGAGLIKQIFLSVAKIKQIFLSVAEQGFLAMEAECQGAALG